MYRRAVALLALLLISCTSLAVAGEPAKPKPEAAKPAEPGADKAGAPKEDDYELQRLLVDTIDQVQRNYVREISRRKLVEAAIKGILTELDPHSSYIAPEDMDRFRTTVESEFGGIGVQIGVDDGHVRVISPLVGSPAYRAGMMAGDRIVEIDGKSAASLTVDDAVRRLKGKEGTEVTLTVIHPGKTVREKITVTREVVHVDTVMGDHRKADDSWDYVLDGQKGIGYIRIAAFSRDTAGQLERALKELTKQKLRGLVLDLRFNPGGLLASAVEVSDLFISEGRIVSTAGRNVTERAWNARKEGTFEGFPMVVLVNRYSASASEIVAACLQDHKRAVIVGERTWGKGSVQNVIPLDELKRPSATAGRNPSPLETHSALKLTTAGYRRPSGKNIDRLPGAKDTDEWGVRPDEKFELKLPDQETATLIAERSRRDVVQPKGGAKPEPPKPNPADGKPDKPAEKFVDRQLQMALNYLDGELAKKR